MRYPIVVVGTVRYAPYAVMEMRGEVTWLLANGANLAGVSKHLGHSGVAITGDFYHHVSPKEQESNKNSWPIFFQFGILLGNKNRPNQTNQNL